MSTVAIGLKNKNRNKKRYILYSLGLLYSAFTFFTGFKVNGGEYKLSLKFTMFQGMKKILDNLIDVKKDGHLD